MFYFFIILVIVVFIFYFMKGKSLDRSNADRLRGQCLNLLNMPTDEAEQVLERLLRRQQEKNPGKTEEWYLDKSFVRS